MTEGIAVSGERVTIQPAGALQRGARPADRKDMADDRSLYLPWYEASPDGLDELAQIKRVVDQLRDRRDG